MKALLVLSVFCWEMFALTKMIMFPFILFPSSFLAIYLSICTIFSSGSYRWNTQTVYSYPYTYLIHLILSADNVYLLLSVLKEINPEYSLEGLMLKMMLQYFDDRCKELTLWKTLWCWERLKVKGERIRVWQRMKWTWHQLNGHEFEQALRDVEGQGSLVWCSPRDLKESDMT